MKIELGLTSFADNQDMHTENGVLPAISNGERIRNVVEEIKLADEVGLDVYGLGNITALTTLYLAQQQCLRQQRL